MELRPEISTGCRRVRLPTDSIFKQTSSTCGSRRPEGITSAPATALITSYLKAERMSEPENPDRQVVVDTEDVSNLLENVAELIGMRASRRVNRTLLRHSMAS